jgi:hypothetical protein
VGTDVPRRKLLTAVFVVAALALAMTGPAAAQCAMCKTVLTSSAEGRAFSQELDRAILLMFVAPYLVFGTLAAVLFRKPLGRRLSALYERLRRRPATGAGRVS